jgi:hypothetical protein
VSATTIAIVAGPAAAGLAGLDGRFDWGSVATVAGAGSSRPDAELVVALGGTGGGSPDVRWLAEPPGEPPVGRVIAPDGDDLWSRALWPARDELFELPPADAAAGVLVVTADEERRAAVLERLADRGVPVAGAAELTAGALAAAATVAFAPDEQRERPMPGAAPAVLAAGRHLIAPRCRTSFGLLAGTDHLAASTEDDVVQYAHALFRFPDSFQPFRVFGRLAAQRHRASVVYGRLVDDLRAEATV